MTTRKQAAAKTERGGQALVMVTLALIAMCGMMGLAVDLGWSFFVQKQAQVAADAAALGAVQEAYQRFSGNFPKPPCGNGLTQAHCAVVPVACQSIANVSNLKNGCMYAERNGFVSGTNRQVVTMEADMDPNVLTSLGVTNIRYFVRARVAQSIPQLFSAAMGNSQGTISAIATAAVAGVITPGSFYGLNQEGDCLSNSAGTYYNCGIDVDVGGANAGNCTNADGTNSGVAAKLCAPSGLFMSSQCNGTAKPGCGSGTGGSSMASGSNYAGEIANGNPRVWGGTMIGVRGSGNVNPPSNFVCGNGTPCLTQNVSVPDPMLNKPQPPLLTPNSPLGTCGVLNGSVPNNATLGPYQYFSYTMVGGVPTPNGAPITIGGTATFSSGGGCAFSGARFTAGASQVNGSFPTTIFYGGMFVDKGNVNFGPGQYVMAGTSSQTGAVFNMDKSTVTGNQATGTMFILTDKSYDGALNSQSSAAALAGMPQLYMGRLEMKNRDVTLYGVTQSAPAALTSVHQNILFWQDRRNSNITMTPSTGVVTSQNKPLTIPPNSNSPEFYIDHGNGSMVLKGVMYQPRGAWVRLGSGGAGMNTSPLQIVTGALDCGNGCGNAGIVLLGSTAPIIKYVTALVQ